MSGNRSRRKGYRMENQLVHLLQDAGIAATRCPVSGAAPGKFGGFDISFPMLSRDCLVEAKHHATGFTKLYRWLKRVHMLIVRTDHEKPLVVMPLDTLIELILKAEGRK